MFRERSFLVLAGMLFPISSAYAFKPGHVSGHAGATEDGVNDFSIASPLGGSADPYTFSDRAVTEIVEANKAVDEVWDLGAGFWIPINHCDAELIHECKDRVNQLRDAAVEQLLATKDGGPAREMVGSALHTIQDFYAHSNWVNLGIPIVEAFGNPEKELPATCSRVSGVEGSYWWEEDEYGPAWNGEATCVVGSYGTLSECGTEKLTTGYFWLTKSKSDEMLQGDYKGKCGHGGEGAWDGIVGDEDDMIECHTDWAGIHKDLFMCDNHSQALIGAKRATTYFIEQLTDEIVARADDPASADEALRALMDVRPSLAFVIDDTGSMGAGIEGVKRVVENIITFYGETPESQPDKYVLVRFGDPTVSDAFSTTDPEALLAAVEAISPSGGGDCPELSQKGTRMAIDASSPGGNVFVFTDASAKDADLGSAVTSAARDKNIRISAVLTGSCTTYTSYGYEGAAKSSDSTSAVDSAYIQQTEETGGQWYFVDHSPSAVAELYSVIEPTLTGDLQPILLVKDTNSTATKSYEFPVDNTIERLTISLTRSDADIDEYSSTDTLELVVTSPSGVVDEDEEGSASDTGDFEEPEMATVRRTDLRAGSILTVDVPETGLWSVSVSGTEDASFFLSVQANTPVGIRTFDFVEVGGVEGHEGWYPLAGLPIFDFPHVVRTEMTEDVEDIEYMLVYEDGEEYETLDLESGLDGFSENQWVGQVVLPAEPLRVKVESEDSDGNPLVRMYSQSFTGQPVRVDLIDIMPAAVAGQSFGASFRVTNLGDDATFEFRASDTYELISESPDPEYLAAGDSIDIAVEFDIPIFSEPGNLGINFVAHRQDDADVRNSVIEMVPLYADTDGDGLSDHQESGTGGLYEDYDGNFDEIADSEQPDVASMGGLGGMSYVTFASNSGTLHGRLLDEMGPAGAIFGTYEVEVNANGDGQAEIEFFLSNVRGADVLVEDEWVESTESFAADGTFTVVLNDGSPEDSNAEPGVITVKIAPHIRDGGADSSPSESESDVGSPSLGGSTYEPGGYFDETGSEEDSSEEKGGCGCANTRAAPAAWVLLLGVVAGFRRRRQI